MERCSGAIRLVRAMCGVPVLAFSTLLPAQAVPASSQPAAAQAATAAPAQTFQNPLLPSGPDPWVTRDDQGFYYFTATTGPNLTIRRTRDLGDLRDAEKKVVWTPPADGPYSREIWAPELHRIGGKWYLYFAADAGRNESHRIYVLENEAANPLEGAWVFKGKLADRTDKWAIDATVFELGGAMYAAWSGWEGDADGEQRLYLAHLSNPWTIDSERVEISRPQLPWETVGDLPGRHVNVNEGPEVLQHAGRTFLVYSASACWTDAYKLGMLMLKPGGDPMNAKSWIKVQQPVFQGDPAAGVYAPGHNGFFRSPDGREDWIVYHANSAPNQGCGNSRSPRMQRFTWKADGTPDFGRPVPAGKAMPEPAQ